MEGYMKIKEIEVIPYKIPYSQPVRISTGVLENADNVLVKLIGDNGIIGIGETQPMPIFQGCSETMESITQVINHNYEPVLRGRDPTDLKKIMFDIDNAVNGAIYASAAVSDALYDLLAKFYGVPLYKILGGLFRDRIEMVWSIGMKSKSEMEKEASWALDKKFRKIKIKVGSPNTSDDIENAFAVRKVLGDKISFRVDANAGYTFKDALYVIKTLNEIHLAFVEQPLSVWDYDGLAKLSSSLDVPIMADESCNSVNSALELIKRQAASIFDIKLAKNGGIFHAQKIESIAHACNIPLYAGNQPCSSIGAAAAVHFYAAMPNVIAGDFNNGPVGWLAGDIVKRPLKLDMPFALVPLTGLGIGVELDEKKLADYAASI
jgi:L-alanine-DL-glutamate epimerase-like enolase superfamily enzyme